MSSEHTNEPGVAIDLARRKRAGASLDASVRHIAKPYVTMARLALARLARDPLARVGGLVLSVLALVAVLADILASDLPIACQWHGGVYLMPNVARPAQLEGLDLAGMRRAKAPGDWLLPPLVPYGPSQVGGPASALLPPFVGWHPLGTDATGRDVFARIVHGARTALGVGLAASAVLVSVGVLLGAVAGYMGGWVDALVARAIESLTAIPTLVLVLVVGALVPHPTTTTLLCTIALTRWTELARLVRGEILQALKADYVTAARALGASSARILWRHVLPNTIAPAIVAAAFALAWVVLIEATVDFLRAGQVDSVASWGELMGESRYHLKAWWLVAFPGVTLLSTLVALNLVGEAARNALDPRLRGEDARP